MLVLLCSRTKVLSIAEIDRVNNSVANVTETGTRGAPPQVMIDVI